MLLVHLTATGGEESYAARIGYGDFVYSFFSTVSYRLEGPGNWGKRFPRLLLDLCDGGLVKNENLNELEAELKTIYKKFEKMPLSDVIYDMEDLSKPMPNDLMPSEDEGVKNLAQLWVTPRGRRIYLDTFEQLISSARHCCGSLILMYAMESIDKQIWIRPKAKGRKYWLGMLPINYG